MFVLVTIIVLYHTFATALAHATGRYRTMTQLDTSHLDPTVSVTVRPSMNIVALLGHLNSNRALHLPNDTLVLDSGASHHMVKDASLRRLAHPFTRCRRWRWRITHGARHRLDHHTNIETCDASVFTPTSARPSKLEPKAKPFIFVGFNNKSKAWTLYDPTTTSFFLSRDIKFDEQVFPARDAPIGPPQPRMPPTTGEWTFVDAAHASRAPPRLSTPPVVHQNRFAVLETDESDDAMIDMSNNGFDTPSDMSRTQFSPSPPASDVTDDSADPIDFLSCPTRATAFAASAASPSVIELEGPTEDPQNWSQAVKSGKEDIWRQAAADDFHSLATEYNCFTPVDSSLPHGAKVLGSRFIFRTKRDQLGKITSHKGRLVAQGFSRRPGIDYDETFAPVAKFTSIRALIARAAAKQLHVHQADVDKAYLHGKLKEDLHMRVPQGVVMPSWPSLERAY
ncbi:BQ5605_C041g11947 [Microbotryum silenes-dioicae]|uniref:BQ5605_C041g11947 protein n=1 Tax=Microbotryum silenes-dioicae TaxID=796604 RepID=A0A2X0MUC5_9BASI|nr:BQ5605_C041g11947 [Microbotryum silenes-dioicae]